MRKKYDKHVKEQMSEYNRKSKVIYRDLAIEIAHKNGNRSLLEWERKG